MTQFNNPHCPQPSSLLALINSVYKNRQLIIQMIRREVVGRYKGSIFGLAWSFLNPILMLIIYTFVFSVVFKSRWGSTGSESKTEFALILFVGMIVFGIFSEAINRAPSLILANTNYVKKVVFPLEILPIISFGAVFFHALVSFGVLLFAALLFNGSINWTVIFLPLILLPLVLLTLGISWLIASLGVYLRDVGQTVSLLTSLLMFLSPVFYPVSAVPARFQIWLMLNPLSFMIEQARGVVIFGLQPNWFGLAIYFAASLMVVKLGFGWFQKTRKGFADVL
jgi:lipopolysaccharide transport system permease protein